MLCKYIVCFTLWFSVFRLLCGFFIMTSPIITQVTYFFIMQHCMSGATLPAYSMTSGLYSIWFTILTVLSSTQKWFAIKSSKRRKDRAYTGLADATSGSIFARSVNRTRCTGNITMYSAHVLIIMSNSFLSPHIKNSQKMTEIL